MLLSNERGDNLLPTRGGTGKKLSSDDLQCQVYVYYMVIFSGGKMDGGGWRLVSVKTSFLFQSRYEKFSIHFKVIIYDVSGKINKIY